MAAIGNVDGVTSDDLVVDFPGYGVYVYANNSTWRLLHGFHPTMMVTADLDGNGQDDIVMDFPGSGFWVYENDRTWRLLHWSPQRVVAGDVDGNGRADLVVDFGSPWGISIFRNNTEWTPLHPSRQAPSHSLTATVPDATRSSSASAPSMGSGSTGTTRHGLRYTRRTQKRS